MSDTLLVTGAAGHLGRRVLANLLDGHGIEPARLVAVTRDPARLADVAARGVTVRRGDFDDPASLASAFAGANRMLLISTDALDRPGARLAQHRAAIAAAEAAGLDHIVYTSMPNPGDSVVTFAPDHLLTERALSASKLSWTVLRNAWYIENLALTLPSALASGQWVTAAGDGRTAYVSREDCARAAASALAAPSSANAVYDVTGPAAVTVAEVAATVSEILKTPIAVVQVTDDALTQGMIGAGVPGPIAKILTSFDTNARLGKFDLVTDAVQRLTGRPPETLRAWFEANGQSLVPKAVGAST